MRDPICAASAPSQLLALTSQGGLKGRVSGMYTRTVGLQITKPTIMVHLI